MVIWKLLLDYKRHYFRVYWIYTFTCLLYFLGKKISHFSTHIIQLPCLLLLLCFAHTSQGKQQCKKFTIEPAKEKGTTKKCNVFKYIFPCHFTTWAMKKTKSIEFHSCRTYVYICMYIIVVLRTTYMHGVFLQKIYDRAQFSLWIEHITFKSSSPII